MAEKPSPKKKSSTKKAVAKRTPAPRTGTKAATTKRAAAKSAAPLMPAPDRVTAPITDEQIRVRAYEIYCGRGCTPGDPNQDWFQAERELQADRR